MKATLVDRHTIRTYRQYISAIAIIIAALGYQILGKT